MNDPLVVEFEVNAAPEHAFDMWTQAGLFRPITGLLDVGVSLVSPGRS